MAAVLAAMPGKSWEPVARFLVGWLRIVRAQRDEAGAGGPEPHPEVLAALELMRPLADLPLKRMPPDLRGVYEGTHEVFGTRIVERVALWNARLADSLKRIYLGEIALMAEAGEAAQQVERLSTDDHPKLAEHLINLGAYERLRHDTGADGAAVEHAVRLSRRAVEASAQSPVHAEALALLANSLAAQANESPSVEAYTEAIAAHHAALAALPADSPHRGTLHDTLALLAGSLGGQVTESPSVEAYTHAIAVYRAIVAALPTGSPHRGPLRGGLAGLLADMGTRINDADLVGDALDLLREEGAHTRDASAELQTMYAMCLMEHATLTGRRAGLSEAVAIMRHLVTTTDDPSGEIHFTLANTLGALNDEVGDPRLGAEAIAAARQAVARQPIPKHYSNLGMRLREQYQLTQRAAYLEEAIGVLRTADETGTEDRLRPRRLARLGHALALWAQRTGDGQALEEAIRILTLARELASSDDSDLGTIAVNLGLAYNIAFDWNWPGARQLAVTASRAAVALLPAGHVKRGRYLANLAGLLARGEEAERAEAVRVLREALAATQEDQPDRSHVESNLAATLLDQYRADRDPATLDEAVALARSAGGRRFKGNTEARQMLAILLLEKAAAGDPGSRREAFDLCQSIVRDPSTAPAVSVDTACLWARGAAEGGLWAEATTAFSSAIGQFPQLTARELLRTDREALLARHTFSVASDAAACALEHGDPELALELLEAGRGILIGQALESRTDLDLLATHAPGLVGEFEALRAEIDALEATSHGGKRPAPAAFRDWRRRWSAFLSSVRAQPGLERFQLPASCRDLLSMASEGPIAVVNVSRYRCDCLLLTADGLTVVPLPELSLEGLAVRLISFIGSVDALGLSGSVAELRAREHQAEQTLEWLWDAVAAPVLDALGFGQGDEEGPWPRIWWMPTGLLAHLPLHAAGRHREPGASVLDRAVSSYASTLAGLRRARRETAAVSGRGVIVAVPAPAGRLRLPETEREAAAVGARFPDATLLVGPAATREAVVTALRDHDWVHLACHGYADILDPARSRLELHDGPLLLRDLWQLRLPAKSFAFLAACDSAQGAARHPDEALHLAAMFQAAGHRHVVGSLWRIADDLAVRVAEEVYDQLAVTEAGPRFDAVPFALHHATRRLRGAYRRTPSLWAAYVHAGP
ncbi:CHAT domain-containing protein [Phytohabitans flavus]